MKFHSEKDMYLFLNEIDRLDLEHLVKEGFDPSDDLMELFLQRRKEIIPGLKNRKRSQIAKSAWRHHRFKIMAGIKRWHKSTVGKRFHRKLGRFLSTRDFRDASFFKQVRTQKESVVKEIEPVADALKALSSAKTHALIELEYYIPFSEVAEYEVFVEHLYKRLAQIESNVFELTDSIEDEDMEFLITLCNRTVLIDSLAEEYGCDSDTVYELIKERQARDSEDPMVYVLKDVTEHLAKNL